MSSREEFPQLQSFTYILWRVYYYLLHIVLSANPRKGFSKIKWRLDLTRTIMYMVVKLTFAQDRHKLWFVVFEISRHIAFIKSIGIIIPDSKSRGKYGNTNELRTKYRILLKITNHQTKLPLSLTLVGCRASLIVSPSNGTSLSFIPHSSPQRKGLPWLTYNLAFLMLTRLKNELGSRFSTWIGTTYSWLPWLQ